MKAVTAQEMRQIETIAIENYGVPALVLMENAGRKTAEALLRIMDGRQRYKALLVAGCGSNGGDAFVTARHLANQDVKLKVYIVGDADKISAAAKINLDILLNMNVDVTQISREHDWDKVKIALAFSDVLVDGMSGTGFHGELSDDFKRMAAMFNAAQKPIVAIDLPTGVEADRGRAAQGAVRATYTVTFGLPKIGLLLYPGALFAGQVEIADIGLPKILLEDEHIKQNLLNTKLVNQMLAERPPDAHKGSCGRVLIVAGSTGMTGAAVLAATGALRGGAGVVTLAVASSLQPIAAVKLTEVMTRPLPEISPGVLGMTALPALLELAQTFDAVVIGPGLGRGEETRQLTLAFLRQVERQVVIDADALYALQNNVDVLKDMKRPPMITPHLGEMAGLLQKSAADIAPDLISAARLAAQKWNTAIALKSARTVVAYPDGIVYINIRGNAGMATAGSGDVLAGIVGAFAAQSNCRALPAAVYLHALAGDIAAESGSVGLVAGDIAAKLPAARRQLHE